MAWLTSGKKGSQAIVNAALVPTGLTRDKTGGQS